MPKILLDDFNNPYEREYEAWINRAIKEYFNNLNIQTQIIAVSPKEENLFPADSKIIESDIVDGIVICLQYKRPTFYSKNKSYQNLYWNMNNPKGQYDKIKNLKNIHYVLPTFANRLWDENALYHCFFWRPKQNDNYKTVWYKQYSTRSIVARCRNDFYRWGTFIEKLYNKEIGQSIKQLDNQTLNGYIHDFVDNYNKIDVDLSDNLNSEFSESLKKTEKEQSEMLYFLHLKI